jgi:S-adenosylmethionine decarboxylase
VVNLRARMWNTNFWIAETNPIVLMKDYGAMLKEAGFTILQICVQKFEPEGFTAVWILAESHLAIHTFPEEGKTYVELSSCNKKMFVRFNEYRKLLFLHGL